MNGHHPTHEGLQKHSVGDIYPLAIVGYGNGDKTTYVVEHLTKGAVLADPATGSIYQGPFSTVNDIAKHHFDGKWLPGRPHYQGETLVM